MINSMLTVTVGTRTSQTEEEEEDWRRMCEKSREHTHVRCGTHVTGVTSQHKLLSPQSSST